MRMRVKLMGVVSKMVIIIAIDSKFTILSMI